MCCVDAMPFNIVLVGFMGCGKSTIGGMLANQLGCDLIDTDLYIQQFYGLSVMEIFKKIGEVAFRKSESQVIRKASGVTGAVIATGGGAPFFEGNLGYLKKNAKIVFLDVPKPVLKRRLAGDATRPLAARMDDIDLLFEVRHHGYVDCADFILAGEYTERETCKRVIESCLK